jgi:hypothetical protein
MALYKKYLAADAILSESGYKNNAYIALPEWFDAEAVPTLSAAMGDNYRIVTDHTFLTGKGMLPVYCFPNTNESNGELPGDQGAKKTRFTPKIFIQGDNAASLELVNNIKNQGVILFMEKPLCPGEFVQFGSGCYPATVDSASNPTGTTNSGKAGWEITFESFTKFFYEGEITEYP